MNTGEGFIPGRSRENARKVLDAARKAKVDVRKVRTTDGGYLVPAKVLDVYEGRQKKTSTRKHPTNKKGE